MTNKCRYFLESNSVGVNRLFVLVYLNQENDSKRFKAKKYYVPKGIVYIYNVIINGKNVYDQANDSDIKRYDEIRKLTIGQGEDYTTGWLLDYDYIKNDYRLIVVDLIRQIELDADTREIQQIESVGQLNNLENTIVANESMFVLTIEKNKEMRLNFSQGSVIVL